MNQLIITLFALCLTLLTLPEQTVGQEFNYRRQSNEYYEEKLTKETFRICRLRGTDPRGSGQYNNFFEKGKYYCACCGGDHTLFSSDTKFDSKTGWPSFYDALPGAVTERPDPDDTVRGSIGLPKTEIICSRCASHLGHLFEDGPMPTGKRYSVNSSALRFVKAGQPVKRTFDAEPDDPDQEDNQ